MHITNLEKAIDMAVLAHAGQKLKNGLPYITHPLAVMSKMTTEDEMIVAVLHDTLEDTSLKHDTILDVFGSRIASAVHALTRRKEQSYDEYIAAVARNPLAKAVKKQDILHNLDLTRNREVVLPVSKLNMYLSALRAL